MSLRLEKERENREKEAIEPHVSYRSVAMQCSLEDCGIHIVDESNRWSKERQYGTVPVSAFTSYGNKLRTIEKSESSPKGRSRPSSIKTMISSTAKNTRSGFRLFCLEFT